MSLHNSSTNATDKTAGWFDDIFKDVIHITPGELMHEEPTEPPSPPEPVILQTPPDESTYIDQQIQDATTLPKKQVRKTQPSTQETKPVSPEEPQQLSPEMLVYNEYFPEITDSSFFAESDPKHIDYSMNTIDYLHALGYNQFRWILGGEYRDENCDKVEGGVVGVCYMLNNRIFTFDELRDQAYTNSMQEAYYPPKIIIGLAHPGCRCSIECYPPNTPEEIPDTAPFLPSNLYDVDLLAYKRELHKHLEVLRIDRYTVLSPEIHKFAVFVNSRIKTAQEDSIADEIIRPITVVDNCISTIGLGLFRAIPKGYHGFLLRTHGTNATAYLVDINAIVTIPVDTVKEIELIPSSQMQADFKTFIKTNIGYGVVLYVLDDNSVVAYFPNIKDDKIISDYTILDIKE